MTAGACLPLLRGSGLVDAEISFIDATVCSYIDDGEILDPDEAYDLLQSAEGVVELDEEDIEELSKGLAELTIPKEPEVVDDGKCEMCDRDGGREFHHLVPKSTHKRYIKAGRLPENLSYVKLTETFGVGNFLLAFGVLICTACHKAIHNAEDNASLAESYNSLERLMDHNGIAGAAQYNSKQKVRSGTRKQRQQKR